MRSLRLVAVLLGGVACGVKAPPRPPVQGGQPPSAVQAVADAGSRPAAVDGGQP